MLGCQICKNNIFINNSRVIYIYIIGLNFNKNFGNLYPLSFINYRNNLFFKCDWICFNKNNFIF